MSFNEILESLQRKLTAAKSPIIARHAVAGIFAALRKPGINADGRATAITLCLSKPYKVIVQEASDQLVALTLSGGLPASESAEFLLSAVTTAGPATAGPLADALCRLVIAATPGPNAYGGGSTAATSAPQPLLRPTRWTSHPLVAALLSCPSTASQLLSSVMGVLSVAVATVAAAAGDSSGGGGERGTATPTVAAYASASVSLERTWSALEPFFSFVLLQRHPSSGIERAGGGGGGGGPTASASSGAALASVALSAWLHSQLVRLAVGGPYSVPPWLQQRILDFLVCHLALGPRSAEADRMQAVQSTTDLLDVLEAVLYDSDGEEGVPAGEPQASVSSSHSAAAVAAGAMAASLLQLAFEILMGTGGYGSGGGGAHEVVAALLRLQGLAPESLQEHMAALSLLTLNASGKELQGLHLLLHKVLQQHRQGYQLQQQRQQQPSHRVSSRLASADAALSMQPLLAAIAFGTSAATAGGAGAAMVPPSAWPAHLAATLQRFMDSGGDGGGAAGSGGGSLHFGQTHGDLCLLRQCRMLLLSLWASIANGDDPSPTLSSPPCDLRRWLRSLELALRQRRYVAASAKAASEQLPFATKISDVIAEAALGAADAHPALTCLLAALLAHPDPWVRAAAAGAARQLVQLLPAAALPLLPLVMCQLRRGSSGTAGGGCSSSSSNSAAQLVLMQLLPVMAADPAVAPYVLRVLEPMLQPESPEVLRCLALKLLCDTWLISGRGWTHVESALNGLGAPGHREPPPLLRVTRAALLRAVCDRDPGRGLELVSALQQAICDPDCPAAAALGLGALSVLAEEDVLDFYAAYRVVHRWYPRLPSNPLVASGWVALLAHGSLDAEAYPDKVVAILDILWSAARHPDAAVRAAAYYAISNYPPDLLEKLQILRPLSQYVTPLLRETDPRVSEAARGLAAVALRFEHANRRRLLLTQPTSTSDVTQEADVADGSGPEAAIVRSSIKGTAYAAAATAREARALRGRLLGRIPKMLLVGVSAGAGGGGRLRVAATAATGGGGSFHPGAALFCYSRPPPPPLPPGSSSAAVAAAAKRAAAEAREAYGARLRDGLRRLAWRGQWHARLAVQAWATFVRHWMYDTGLSAAEVATVLVGEWDGTATAVEGGGGSAGGVGSAAGAVPVGGGASAAPAAVLEGVGLAAGALCLTGEGLPEADVSSLTARLLQQAQSGRSSGISRSSLVGAALAASTLHPTDWAARQQVLGELRAQLLAGPTAVVRSAAATALAVLAGSLAADPAIYIRAGAGEGVGDPSRELSAVAEAVSCLIATLAALCKPLAATLAHLAARGMPPGWPDVDGGAHARGPRPLKDEVDEQEVLPSTMLALTSLLCDINRAHGLPTGALPDLLAALVRVAGDHDISGVPGSSPSAATVVAALEASAALAPEVMRYQRMQRWELVFTLQTVRNLIGIRTQVHSSGYSAEEASITATAKVISAGVPLNESNAGAVLSGDGRVCGAAAYCLACVAVAALRQGLLTPEVVLELCLVASPSSSSSRAGSENVGEVAMLAVVSELAEQANGAGGASKGQHIVAARTGAVAGLAAVLLPPSSSLVDALSLISPTAISNGLLAQPEHLTTAKAALGALERHATADTDPWVSGTAAFHLAAISAAVEMAEDNGDDGAGGGLTGSGTAGAGSHSLREGEMATGGEGSSNRRGAASGGPKPLSCYPPEGAARPLVTAFMERSQTGSLSLSCLTDTLLALAAAPALPAADWPTACRILMARAFFAAEAPQTAAVGVQLLAATLLVVLTHGSVPSLGLGALLEELVAPTRFTALPSAVQGLMLVRLPAILRSLAAKRAAAVVQGLPGLLAAAVQKTATQPSAAAATAASTLGDGSGGGGGGGGEGFPWSTPVGLDDPGLQLLWLRRIRQALPRTGTAGDGSNGDGGFGAASWLAAHCWLGLLGVCRGWQAKDAAMTQRDITQSTHMTIAALASQLPPLPPLQAGEAVQLMAWAAAPLGPSAAGSSGTAAAASTSGGLVDDWESYGIGGRPLAAAAAAAAAAVADGGGGGGGGAAPAARAAVTLWSLAAYCLRCLRPDFLMAQILTEAAMGPAAAAAVSPSPRALASLQLRCILVVSGHVSYRELMPVRTAAASAVFDTEGHTRGDALVTPLSLSLASTPQAFQVQVLLQTLDAARTSLQPGPCLELAAALVAACLGYASGTAAATAPELCVTLSSQHAALDCLPYTLPRLLSRAPWSSSCEAIAQALLAVVREEMRREAAARTGPSVNKPGPWLGALVGCPKRVERVSLGTASKGPLNVVLACLWALRDVLPAYTYDQLHATLSWQTLGRVVDVVEA